MKPVIPTGLYAITSQAICRDTTVLVAAVKAALDGGAVMIQYRDKLASVMQRHERAQALLALCRRNGVPLLINDDLELAAAIGADGVHLGASDAPLAQARTRLGSGAIIGVTCANSLERAVQAAAGGANYIALGRFFPSRTKPEAPQATLELLTEVHHALPRTPICAIGGITPDNAAAVIERGASMLAAIEAVFGAGDIAAAAAQFKVSFQTQRGIQP